MMTLVFLISFRSVLVRRRLMDVDAPGFALILIMDFVCVDSLVVSRLPGHKRYLNVSVRQVGERSLTVILARLILDQRSLLSKW